MKKNESEWKMKKREKKTEKQQRKSDEIRIKKEGKDKNGRREKIESKKVKIY